MTRPFVSLLLCFFLSAMLFTQTNIEKMISAGQHQGLAITRLDSEMVMVEDRNRMKKQFFNVGEFKGEQNVAPVDSMIILISTLDTNLYTGKYQFWRDLPISNIHVDIVVNDANNNGQVEFYGFYTGVSNYPFSIFEFDSMNNFKILHSFPDSIGRPYGMYDLNGDGNKDIFVAARDHHTHFCIAPLAKDSLPIQVGFTYQQFNGQLGNVKFGDFDKDKKADVAIAYLGSGMQVKMKVAEYNSSITNLDTIFTFIPPDQYASGFAIGDFDLDGKTDIVMGSVHGDVYVLETNGDNNYPLVWKGTVQTLNGYIQFETQDIDGNGKPEFWVGGQSVSRGIRLVCFESDSDNHYSPVYVIAVPEISVFYPFDAFASDMNNDGKEELCFSFGSYLIVLKFSGIPNHPSYNIWYYKTNEFENQNGEIDFVSTHDINGDGVKEIFIQYRRDQIDITRIFSPTSLVSVHQQQQLITPAFTLLQNYPNPFNPSTKIRFNLSNERQISIIVYDVLGREIKHITNEKLHAGEHTLEWNGMNDHNEPVPSGVYFVTLRNNENVKTIKAVLLR